MRVLIIGCGYAGMATGARLASAGHQVFGLRRSPAADVELAARGITPISADITDPASLARIEPRFDAVINTVSSSRGGVDEYRAVYLEGTRNVLDWLSASPPERYLYTSSTSVYAQNDGSIVTEESPAKPDSETSRILRETENLLLSTVDSRQFPVIILRASGIYGPGRGHLFKQFLRGEAVLRDEGAAFLNMIHLEDAAGALAHFLTAGEPGGIYNLTDNEPVTQIEFFSWLAARLKKPLPPSAPAEPARKRGLTNKRVSNAKLKSTGFSLQFATFREGYTAEIQRLGLSANFDV